MTNSDSSFEVIDPYAIDAPEHQYLSDTAFDEIQPASEDTLPSLSFLSQTTEQLAEADEINAQFDAEIDALNHHRERLLDAFATQALEAENATEKLKSEVLRDDLNKLEQAEAKDMHEYNKCDCVAVIRTAKSLDLIGSIYGMIGKIGSISTIPPVKVIAEVAGALGKLASHIGADEGIHRATKHCLELEKKVSEGRIKREHIAAEWRKQMLNEVSIHQNYRWRTRSREQAMNERRPKIHKIKAQLHSLDPVNYPRPVVYVHKFAVLPTSSDAKMQIGAQWLSARIQL